MRIDPAPSRRSVMLAMAAAAAGGDALAADASPRTALPALADALWGALPERERGVLYSPSSVMGALGLLALGSGGQALALHGAALGAHRDVQGVAREHARLAAGISAVGGESLTSAAGAWVATGSGFDPAWRALASGSLAPELSELDFSAGGAHVEINRWVSSATRGHIREILAASQVGPSTDFVIATAMHFSGRWLQAFDLGRTLDAPFHVAPGRQVPARMMHGRVNALRGQVAEGSVACLDHAETGLSLWIGVPGDGIGTSQFLASVQAAGGPVSWLSRAPVRRGALDVALPRLSLSFGKGILDEVGAIPEHARLVRSGVRISGGGAHAVSALQHRATLSADERGTTAAAATAAVATRSMIIEDVPAIRADRPFILALADRDLRFPVMVGFVANPAA